MLTLVLSLYNERNFEGNINSGMLVCLCEQKGSLWSVLEKLRDKGNSMPEKQILQILRGICAGLKAIHEKGYAHR